MNAKLSSFTLSHTVRYLKLEHLIGLRDLTLKWRSTAARVK